MTWHDMRVQVLQEGPHAAPLENAAQASSKLNRKLGNAGIAHRSRNTKIIKDCFQHSWEIMLKLKSCYGISRYRSKTVVSLWSKLLPFGSFFERAGRQIVGQSFCRPKSALRCRCHVELRERWWCKPIPGRGWTDCEIQRPGRKEKFWKIVHICRLQTLRCLSLLCIWMR